MPVEVVGVKDVLAGLAFINDDMRDKIRAAVREPMQGVAAKAKGFAPGNSGVLSGWAKDRIITDKYKPFPRYDAATVKAGIGYNDGENKTFKNGFRVSNYVYNVSAAGRIYETSGRNNPQGRAPFQGIIPETGAPQGTIQGFEGRKRAREYTYNKSTKAYLSNNPFAGYQFVTALPALTQQPRIKGTPGRLGKKTKGRLIFKAFAQDSGKVYEAIAQAINSSAITFNKSTEIKKVPKVRVPTISAPGFTAYGRAS